MSTVLPPVRGKTWVFQITALCIVLGMLLALSLKTQRQVAAEGVPSRLPALKAGFLAAKEENEALRKQLADFRGRVDKLESDQAAGVKGAKALEESLQEARVLAGLVPVRGPGVIVTLNDSPNLNPDETNKDVIESSMVHYRDILDVVNELFSSGAEAISVNDQRIVATSGIRCAGATILVNAVHVQRPFRIAAVGNASVLAESLKEQGGPAFELFLLDMIKINTPKRVTVPAYSGSTLFRYAQPATGHRD